MTDTIFALATAPGRAGVAVVRLSGPAAGAVLAALAGRVPEPRRAVLTALVEPTSGEVLDRGLMLWFPAPSSFTGEDVAELHLHGGRAVVTGVLEALARRPGLRPAEPGEFSRRAVRHGRMDLTAAEGLADLVAAETAAQRRQALRQMDGALARLYEGWRAALVGLLAHLEAAIDFPDEDLPDAVADQASAGLATLAHEIAAHLADGGRGERLREGIRVAIVGPPNAGKSTLLNRLAGREAAIVAATAGTTRDVIEVHLDLGGLPLILADTAGLRDAEEAVEAEGVRRALAWAGSADLKVVVFDGTVWPARDAAAAALVDDDALVVVNKADLLAGPMPVPPVLALSARSGAGLDALEKALAAEAARRWAPGAAPVLTRLRHRAALEDCVAALRRATAAALPELRAEDVRLAARALGRITGRVDVEELLEVIFRDFCIGK